MMKCKDISQLIAAGEAVDLGCLKRLELKVHLLICRHCRTYARQIRTLGTAARRLTGMSEPTEAQLQALEDQICARICNDGPGGGS